MAEGYLLTKTNSADRALFMHELHVLQSLQVTYSMLADAVIERIGRDTYVVKYTKEDVIQADVFVVQRVPIYEIPTHL